MARRRFFVDEIHSGKAQITGDNATHLTRVLRVAVGEKYEISDNQSVYLAEVDAARKSLVSFSILENLPVPEPSVHVTVLASLVRFERFELMLEKATELGVSRVIPIQAERSEKGLEQAAEKRLARWRRVVREASEQSRRAKLPEVESPVKLTAAIEPLSGYRYLLDENPGAPPILSALPATRKATDEVFLATGPEGGWTDRERAMLEHKKWRNVSLGPSVLKTETAVIAALAVLNAAWDLR
jgi:16S rRNA (uracil1498-N3)-methyltransferase